MGVIFGGECRRKLTEWVMGSMNSAKADKYFFPCGECVYVLHNDGCVVDWV